MKKTVERLSLPRNNTKSTIRSQSHLKDKNEKKLVVKKFLTEKSKAILI